MPGSSRWRGIASSAGHPPSKVELTASPQAPLATLLAAGVRLRPDLLVVDSLQPSDASALGDLLSAGARGVVAAGEPQAMAGVPRQSVDRRGQRRSAARIVRRDLHRGCDRRPALRLSKRRRVLASDGDGVIRRDRAQGRLWRGAFQRAALAAHYPPVRPAATYRSGAENPLRHRPISGTNRFEMRGILRVGTLQRERPAEGTIA